MFRTLFAKFLLWFWLALAAMLGAETYLETTSLEQGLYLRQPGTTGPLAFYADLAREALARNGDAGLDSLRRRIETHSALLTFCTDRAGAEPDGRAVPRGASRAGIVTLQRGSRMLVEDGSGFYVGYPIGRQGGRDLALVLHPVAGNSERRGSAAAGGRGSGWLSALPYDLGLRALAMLLLGGLSSFLLARYITAPVIRLRHATRRLGAGELGARVGAERRRRDELADLGRDFDRMADRLESLVAAQRRLISDISHELRSPLARMSVAIGLLRQGGADDRERMIARLETEAERLNQLIGDLLALSRVEVGDPGPGAQSVDLRGLAAEVADDARFEARARRCEVRLEGAPAVAVRGEPGLLHSALENVVRNAVRHTGEGTAVEITIERRAGAGAPEAVIAVRDHGPGLPADQLERIFEPFYRVDDARGRDSGGTGLGLAITRRVVAQHGGRIQATAAPGGGLVVTMILPGAEPADG